MCVCLHVASGYTCVGYVYTMSVICEGVCVCMWYVYVCGVSRCVCVICLHVVCVCYVYGVCTMSVYACGYVRDKGMCHSYQ